MKKNLLALLFLATHFHIAASEGGLPMLSVTDTSGNTIGYYTYEYIGTRKFAFRRSREIGRYHFYDINKKSTPITGGIGFKLESEERVREQYFAWSMPAVQILKK